MSFSSSLFPLLCTYVLLSFSQPQCSNIHLSLQDMIPTMVKADATRRSQAVYKPPYCFLGRNSGVKQIVASCGATLTIGPHIYGEMKSLAGE